METESTNRVLNAYGRAEMWKPKLHQKLMEIVGEDYVITEREDMLNYLFDETCPAVRPKPAENLILVKPKTPNEISEILKLANMEKIPVFPRGAGTGLAGGAVPTADGIILSMERLDRILEIDAQNLMAVVEAGVPFSRLNAEAEKHGLFFPPHPGEETAQMGGITACNAGGVRCVKYGVIRDFVKGLEVVIPTGEILKLGGKLLKDVTGYSLMHLFIGSGGTLGVITKIVVRLYPKPKTTASLLISFNDRRQAVKTVPAILREGTTPLAVEYVERGLMEYVAKKLGKPFPQLKGPYILYIIIEGENEEEAYHTAERIYSICEKNSAFDGLIETGKRKQEELLAIRSNIYTSLKPDLIDILDISLPISKMAEMLDFLDSISEKYKVRIVSSGHVADGNLHPHIIGENVEKNEMKISEMKREIYSEARSLGGQITGEHGVGKIRTGIMAEMLSEKECELMKALKKIFDPNNILNPGAIIPSK
jgi:glycolate oxidase